MKKTHGIHRVWMIILLPRAWKRTWTSRVAHVGWLKIMVLLPLCLYQGLVWAPHSDGPTMVHTYQQLNSSAFPGKLYQQNYGFTNCCRAGSQWSHTPRHPHEPFLTSPCCLGAWAAGDDGNFLTSSWKKSMNSNIKVLNYVELISKYFDVNTCACLGPSPKSWFGM